MINFLRIQNFKSHQDTSIHFGNLTLLCGQNGVGKSSIIQVFLLLRQSFQKNVLFSHLSLNKPLCYLGKTKDVLSAFAQEKKIEFELKINDQDSKLTYGASEDLDYLKLDGLLTEKETRNLFAHPNEIFDKKNKNIALFNTDFQYISANREAKYESNDYEIGYKQISVEEGRTELTAQFLHKYQKENVLAELLHPSQTENNLLAQTIAWIREINSGISIIPKNNGGAYDIRYHLEGLPQENEFSAKNIAFGVSYTLPILVAILSAQKGALLIIENPEAHLHPYGQAKLTELFCLAAQADIQIIVETHSDHIVNGVLVQCKKFETESKGIDKNKVKIWHFNKDENSHLSQAIEVEIREKGRIRNAPKGFFDQIDKDLNILI